MEFIQLDVDVDNDIDMDNDDDDQVSVSKDDYTFIHDSEHINGNSGNFYRGFENATRDLDEPINNHEDWLNKRGRQPENYLSHMTKKEMKLNLMNLTVFKLEIKILSRKC